MDALGPHIRRIKATDPVVSAIVDKHLALMIASSPACSRHAMTADALEASGADFYAAFEDDLALAIGAIKRLDATHGELKSMHVLPQARGRGVGAAMLRHLLDRARALGLCRVSLETGSQPPFFAAHRLYEAAGFRRCDPFGSYSPDPNSVFMTLELRAFA